MIYIYIYASYKHIRCIYDILMDLVYNLAKDEHVSLIVWPSGSQIDGQTLQLS